MRRSSQSDVLFSTEEFCVGGAQLVYSDIHGQGSGDYQKIFLLCKSNGWGFKLVDMGDKTILTGGSHHK